VQCCSRSEEYQKLCSVETALSLCASSSCMTLRCLCLTALHRAFVPVVPPVILVAAVCTPCLRRNYTTAAVYAALCTAVSHLQSVIAAAFTSKPLCSDYCTTEQYTASASSVPKFIAVLVSCCHASSVPVQQLYHFKIAICGAA
jgi:hypothetical protein